MARLNGKTIQIKLTLLGSIDSQKQILSRTIQPAAWSPASSLEVNDLRVQWQQKNQGKDIFSDTDNLRAQSLLYSPLVFAVWKDYADVLLHQYGKIDWATVHQALVQPSWAALGGGTLPDSSRPVRFGHTRPDLSNSGLLTLVMIAYTFFQEQDGLTREQVRKSEFLAYLDDFERRVTAFGSSSGPFLDAVVAPQYQGQYDVVTTYENLVLQLQNQPLMELFYPDWSIVSDHPFVVVQADWVHDEQKEAAQVWRKFLLDIPQQQLALASGFRPTNPHVQITDEVPGNVFLKPRSGTPIPLQIQSEAISPSEEVSSELKTQWEHLPHVTTQTIS